MKTRVRHYGHEIKRCGICWQESDRHNPALCRKLCPKCTQPLRWDDLAIGRIQSCKSCAVETIMSIPPRDRPIRHSQCKDLSWGRL